MIDVKLTASGLWWTACLFVWMGRRHAGLVDLLGELLEDSGNFLCLFCLRVLDRLWTRTASFMFLWIYFLLLRFAHMSEFIYYLMWIYLWDDDMATWGVCYYSAVMFLLFEINMHVSCELFEDVMSISWIFIIFAWFIALIEIGSYNWRSGESQNSIQHQQCSSF